MCLVWPVPLFDFHRYISSSFNISVPVFLLPLIFLENDEIIPLTGRCEVPRLKDGERSRLVVGFGFKVCFVSRVGLGLEAGLSATMSGVLKWGYYRALLVLVYMLPSRGWDITISYFIPLQLGKFAHLLGILKVSVFVTFRHCCDVSPLQPN